MAIKTTIESRSKPWYLSRTLLGAAIIVSTLYPNLQEFFEENRFPTAGEWYELAGVFGGSLLVVYGRLVAQTVLQFPGQNISLEDITEDLLVDGTEEDS
ncbi:MAG: hypothetical protein AAFX78_02010 [Cyanobacteria bacterium J06638_20]